VEQVVHALGGDRQRRRTAADGVFDRGGERRQEASERTFAGFLGAEGAVGIQALDDVDFDLGRFGHRRHAVVEQVGDLVQAVGLVGSLLGQRLAHAHPHRALDLAFDRHRVDREAAVECGPHLLDGDRAELLIDADLHHLCRVGKAHRRAHRAAALLAALELGRAGEDALGGDRAGAFERFLDDVGECDMAIGLAARAGGLAEPLELGVVDAEPARGGGDEEGLEVLCCLCRGVADHEGHARGVGAVVLGRDRRVIRDHAQATVVDAEHLGDDLGDDGRRALADVGGAGQDGDAGVEVELEQDHRMGFAVPVHRLGGTTDEVRTGHAEPAPLAELAAAGAPAARLLDAVEAVDGKP